jgi:hypothetical protein
MRPHLAAGNLVAVAHRPGITERDGITVPVFALGCEIHEAGIVAWDLDSARAGRWERSGCSVGSWRSIGDGQLALDLDCQPSGILGGSSALPRGQGVPGLAQSSCGHLDSRYSSQIQPSLQKQTRGRLRQMANPWAACIHAHILAVAPATVDINYRISEAVDIPWNALTPQLARSRTR